MIVTSAAGPLAYFRSRLVAVNTFKSLSNLETAICRRFIFIATPFKQFTIYKGHYSLRIKCFIGIRGRGVCYFTALCNIKLGYFSELCFSYLWLLAVGTKSFYMLKVYFSVMLTHAKFLGLGNRYLSFRSTFVHTTSYYTGHMNEISLEGKHFCASNKKVKNKKKSDKAFLEWTASETWGVGVWILINFYIRETMQQLGRVASCLYCVQNIWLIYKTTTKS